MKYATRIHRVALVAVLSIASGFLGCQGDRGAGETVRRASGVWEGAVRDSAGVAIVENGSTGVWKEEDAWRFEEELRIGAGDDPDYQFALIVGIGVASDGRLYVLDQQAQTLRMYGADGVYLATLGGPGSGPGEFGPQAGPVLVGPADTLVIPDLGNARVTLMAPDGSPAGSYRLELTDGIPARWADRPSGVIVNQIRPITLPGQASADSMDSIVERDRDGAAVDTLLRVPSGKTLDFSSGVPRISFFVPEPVWALYAEEGLLFARNDDYSIQALDGSGRIERIIRKPFDRLLVTETDEEILLESLERVWTDAGVPAQALPTLLDGISFAETFPAFMQILPGPDGTIWVQHVVAPATMSEQDRQGLNPLLSLGAREWDVFDEEGRFLGVVTMPDRFQPLRFVGDRVYGVWRDDFDVQYVMALRLVT